MTSDISAFAPAAAEDTPSWRSKLRSMVGCYALLLAAPIASVMTCISIHKYPLDWAAVVADSGNFVWVALMMSVIVREMSDHSCHWLPIALLMSAVLLGWMVVLAAALSRVG